MSEFGNKRQIIFIHGGDSYDSYQDYWRSLTESNLDYERLKPSQRWQDWIAEQMEDVDILTPSFPNKQNAKYAEWKIYFEKMIPFFGSDVRLVGHSLGAMFLAKYLHENSLDKPVAQLVLLAAGYDETSEDYGEFWIESATGLEQSARQIYLMHSEDDFVVPYQALDKYIRDLPTAKVYRFTDRNHFLDSTFPELLDILMQK